VAVKSSYTKTFQLADHFLRKPCFSYYGVIVIAVASCKDEFIGWI